MRSGRRASTLALAPLLDVPSDFYERLVVRVGDARALAERVVDRHHDASRGGIELEALVRRGELRERRHRLVEVVVRSKLDVNMPRMHRRIL